MAKIRNPQAKKLDNLNWLISPSCDAEQYRALSRDTRIIIARKKLKWFNPPHDRKAEGEFNTEWWNKILNGCKTWSDERTCALWVSVFPDRTRKEWSQTDIWSTVEFETQVTRDNAYSWYRSLPDHLRKVVDKEMEKRPSGATADRDAIYDQVFGIWGDRPELPNEPKDDMDGLSIDDSLRIEVWREWVHLYDHLQLIETILEQSVDIQKSRDMLSKALGLSMENLPDQGDGLDDQQAATVRWIQSTGATPIEYIVDVYRDENLKTSDRLAAARSILDFVHRRVPVKQEVKTETTVKPKLDPAILKSLSDKDLALLETLLSKLNEV